LEGELEKDFTIVGVMKRPTWEPMSAPGYTVLTYLPEDHLATGDTVNASVTWKKVKRAAVKDAEQLGKTLNLEEPSFNNNLLLYYGVISNEHMITTFFSLIAIF